eukprot:Phypoly_transcript_10666.p1 GENE.Phypoly_transcript_10666~~Phypoly_transcript_10666.p1  ORF type:complete len:364 (+),score=53.44 Phypoly_transcript_10666:114-1094(+)
MTGWWALDVKQMDLTVTTETFGSISSQNVHCFSWYDTTTPYVYNNEPHNKGGVVPPGGMVIDGFHVPEGTVVVQFRDFSGQQILVEGDCGKYGKFAGVMFRGCRWRSDSAFGMLNDAVSQKPTGGKIWFHFNDLGGIEPMPNCQFAIKVMHSQVQCYRNYISLVATGIQAFSDGPGNNLIENFIEDLAPCGNDPRVFGIKFTGGDQAWRVERNHISVGNKSQSKESYGIAFLPELGPFLGNGLNDDGEKGYIIANNHLGRRSRIFAGLPAGAPQNAVCNLKIIGNHAVNSPSILIAEPVWGKNGNVERDNTWVDGPNIGKPWNMPP